MEPGPAPIRSSDPGPTVLRWGGGLVVAFCLGWVLYALRGVLTPVLFAWFIAYLLDPVVDRFEAVRVPRGLAIVVVLTLAFVAFGVFLLLVVPPAVADARAFADELPRKWHSLQERFAPWLAQWGLDLPSSPKTDWGDLLRKMMQSEESTAAAGRALGPLASTVSWIVGGTASALGAAVGLLMVPILAFYFLYDFDRMIAATRELIPRRVRRFVVDIASEIDRVLSQFIRGQLTVMVILAVLYAAGYAWVGVRLAVVIGIVAGLLSFIPYVGGGLALGLALLMCALDFQGWEQVLAVGAVYAVIQLLEGFLITPKIVGDRIGLSAVWVLLALMVGGEIFGFMGVLLALPAAAVAKIFVVRGLRWYRGSSWFLDGDPSP